MTGATTARFARFNRPKEDLPWPRRLAPCCESAVCSSTPSSFRKTGSIGTWQCHPHTLLAREDATRRTASRRPGGIANQTSPVPPSCSMSIALCVHFAWLGISSHEPRSGGVSSFGAEELLFEGCHRQLSWPSRIVTWRGMPRIRPDDVDHQRRRRPIHDPVSPFCGADFRSGSDRNDADTSVDQLTTH